ncbi:hypothetical protein [Pectobacterium sp. B2J-2]|uniref:hypothetical protein n=1 Tax=Pectobacterium sp. B2J-2 TaxID=3385372 RepID=UPI0038FCC28D
MKYFHWEFIKSHVNITHLIAFSLGVIVICFLDALVFEKSIADWVSASANTLMAGAALYAAWNAKDWLTIKKKESSLPLIVKFHESHILPLEENIRRTLLGIEIASNELVLHETDEDLREWRKDFSTQNGMQHIDNISRYIKESYDRYVNFYMKDVFLLRKSETQLYIYGWKLDKKELYEELRKKKAYFFESALHLLNDLDNYTAILYEKEKVLRHRSKIGDDSIFFDIEIINKIHSSVKELQDIEKNINTLTKELSFNIWK